MRPDLLRGTATRKYRSPLRLALIVPRYGPDVLGGAETFARDLAEHLPSNEFQVTVLTTCARDLVSWRNELPPGLGAVNGIPVLRFAIHHGRRDARLFRHLTDRVNRGEPLSLELQELWLEHNAHSPELYRYLKAHGNDFDWLVILPYLFGTTIFGSAIHPDKTILCPCLHDEPYAYLADVRAMLAAVRGLMFVSEPEQLLAEEKLGVRHPRVRVVGYGLDDYQADGGRFRRKFGLDDPFLLYAGRLDPAKNVLDLISCFITYRHAQARPDLKLVLAGSGPLPLPAHPDLVQAGFLSREDLHDAYAAASVVCQPSLVESFSIVLLEAWLAGTPVLVHGDCAVTMSHVQRSNGGLYYRSAAEFAAGLTWLLDHPEARRDMGALGRAYTLSRFNWPAVLDRFRSCLEACS